MQLWDLTQETFSSYFSKSVGEGTRAQRYLSEVLGAINRGYYSQDNDMNAFAGLVSQYASDGNLFHVKEGHEKLVESIAKLAGVSVHLGSRVTRVSQIATSQFVLHVGGKEHTMAYDAVVLAAPLTGSKLELENIPYTLAKEVEYRRTVVTFVQGMLRSEYFGLLSDE